MTRRVSVTIMGNCGLGDAKTAHQQVAIQLSIGDNWVPPEPLIYPDPKSGSEEVRNVDVGEIAKALQQKVEEAISRGVSVSNLSKVRTISGIRCSALLFTFSFDTDADEVDFSISGIKRDGHIWKRRSTQVRMGVTVSPGSNTFRVKEVNEGSLMSAVNHGWVDRNGPILPGKSSYRGSTLRPGEGKHFGSQLCQLETDKVSALEPIYSYPSLMWQFELQCWELDPLVMGFFPEPINSMVKGVLVTWEEAMTMGATSLVDGRPFHWDPFRLMLPPCFVSNFQFPWLQETDIDSQYPPVSADRFLGEPVI